MVSHMKMKFSSAPTPRCRHLHLVYHGDAPGSPGPSCRSLLQYSTLRNLSTRSADPSNACANSGIPVADGAMSCLSISSPTDLCSDEENTLCACGHDPCSPLLSVYVHPHCYISVSAILDTASGCLPVTLHNGTSSPTPGDMSNCLPYDHCVDNLPCHKDNNLYRNLSRRNKLRGFNPIVG